MDNHTTTSTRSTRRARGNATAQPARRGTLDFTRACEVCGAIFMPRRPWARFCCPTCRAHAHDAKTGRMSHVSTGKRPRRRALEV